MAYLSERVIAKATRSSKALLVPDQNNLRSGAPPTTGHGERCNCQGCGDYLNMWWKYRRATDGSQAGRRQKRTRYITALCQNTCLREEGDGESGDVKRFLTSDAAQGKVTFCLLTAHHLPVLALLDSGRRDSSSRAVIQSESGNRWLERPAVHVCPWPRFSSRLDEAENIKASAEVTGAIYSPLKLISTTI